MTAAQAVRARCHDVNTGRRRPIECPVGGGPVLVYMVGNLQLWRLGRVAATMPAPEEAWPPRLRDAWRTRLEANLMLVCPACGAVATGRPPLGVTLEHATTCDASDIVFGALLAEAAT